MPERIQQRRTKGWRKPENTVSVARPGKWGNPFLVGVFGRDTAIRLLANAARGIWSPNAIEEGEPDSLWTVAYRAHHSWTERLGSHPTELIRAELRGKNLMCFCPLEDADRNRVPCHADVLLDIANQ